MLELAAVFITLGAVLYHNLSVSLFVISLFSLSFSIFLSIYFRTRQGVVFSFLLGFLTIFGALAVASNEKIISNDIYGDRAFTAKVISVDRRLNSTVFVVKEKNNKLQIFSNENLKIFPGDTVSIRGRVEKPEKFLTDSGRIFDYPGFLESRKIVAIARNTQVNILETGRFSLERLATKSRFEIADIFSKNISFPSDGISAGMLVGYQGGLPQGIQSLFRDTGVLHILVLSGYNITLLAGFLAILMKTLPFRLRTIITIFCIVLIVLISGSGIASIRAGIMGSIALFAGLVRKTYQPLRALTLSYLIFFFISPATIFSDPGFHLSFLATFFMIMALPKVQDTLKIKNTAHGINTKEILLLSILMPLFILPYTMYFSGLFPISSPISNAVLSLVAPLIMMAGAILLVFSIFTPVAELIGSFISSLGEGVVWFLNAVNSLPKWQTPEISWAWVVLFYLIGTFVIFRKEIIAYARQLHTSLLQPSNSSES